MLRHFLLIRFATRGADGDRDRGQFIKAGAVLVFELEILEVKGDHKAKPEL